MHILENYSCFQQFFFKFSIFYTQKKTKKKQEKHLFPPRIFLRTFFLFSEAGHIPDFENEDNISIGISLTFEVICTHLICT